MKPRITKDSKVRKTCRSCGLQFLIPVLSLGELCVSNFVAKPGVADKRTYPLDVVLCDPSNGGCGLLQLKHSVSPDKMYRNYWYFSGVNATMKDELAGIAKIAEEISEPKSGDIAVDIGANDGTLLRAYKKKVKKVGFEPARNLIHYASNGTDKVFNDFFDYRVFNKEFGEKKAKIITAIAMFYDLDDPNAFVEDIRKLLDPEGIFIIQMSYLVSMLKQNAFDNICHEHLEYYSLSSLEPLLKRHGLEIFDVELNDVNGGSFRVYVRHKGSKIGETRIGRSDRLDYVRTSEDKWKLNSNEPYRQFVDKVAMIKKELTDFIKSEVKNGKKIYVYGASTKGNTLLQFFNLDTSLIQAAAERNPIKWGKKTIGTNIPIISEEEARHDRPDYFLILPWHFLSEFVEREKDYLKNGGKFIVPLPEFRIIG